MPGTTARAPLAILVLVACFLAPTELSLYLGGLRLPPHRIALLILMPLAAWRILTDPRQRVRSFDVLFGLYNAWTLAIFVYHHGSAEGLQFGGSQVVESFGAYLVARAYVRDAAAFHGSLRLLVIAVGLSALIALPETITGWHYVHDLMGALTGYKHPVAHETRLGLTRAYGTFDHPIHYGTFTASVLALAWFATHRRRQRHRRAGTIAAATVLGLSSAPILCLGVQAALIVWNGLTRGIQGRVPLTLAIVLGLMTGISLVADRSPFAFVATGMTLDPWTGYYRLVIWENGLLNVWGAPWTGIGLNDWTRPWWMVSDSVDAFWLLVAMRGGIPAFLLLAFAITSLAAATHRCSRRADEEIRRIAMGWMMSLIGLALIACTVHYWNVLYAYFFFFLGLAGWIADPARHRRPAVGPITTAATPESARQVPRPSQPAWPPSPAPMPCAL